MQYAPDHRVTIKRKATGYREEDVSADVLSLAINKGYAKAAGSFQVVTTFNRSGNGVRADGRIDELLQPDDVVHIELDAGDGKGLRSRLIGLVSRVSRSVKVNPDQSVTRRVLISGMDFGKLLIRHQCVTDLVEKVGVPVVGFGVLRIPQGQIFAGTPHEIIRSMAQSLLIGQIPWVEPYFVLPDVPVPGVTSADYARQFDHWVTWDKAILESTGSVWSAMKTSANEPYNALTTETHNGKLHIILEKYPFDPKRRGKLSRPILYEIRDDHIKEEDLGIDDSDRVNYLWLKANVISTHQQNFALQYLDLVAPDLEDIRAHGFHPFYPETNFTPTAYRPWDNAMPDIREEVKARTQELWERNRYNHTHESGSLVVKGNPDIKAGDGVLVTSSDMEYFVEGYTEHYLWGELYVTTLQLTRGQKHGG